MKLSIVALATALAVSSTFAVAQSDSSTNGLSLGKSMPGTTAGVPYPNPAADGAVPVGSSSAKRHGAPHPKHRKPSKM
jgi:hypothetical protein